MSKEIKQFLKSIKGDKFFHPVLNNIHEDIYHFIRKDSKIVGMFMLRGWEEGYDIPSFGMIVHPDYRKQGIGNCMLGQAISICRLLNCKKIRLTVDKENIIAKNMYKKAGFEFKGNVGFKYL